MVSLNGEHDCMRRKKHGSLLMTASMPPAATYFRPRSREPLPGRGSCLVMQVSPFSTPLPPIPCRPPVSDTHCHTIVYIRCSTKYLSCCTGSYISTYGIRLLHMKATSHDVRIQYSLEYTTVAESGPSYACQTAGEI
jgi:hypothetical protein